MRAFWSIASFMITGIAVGLPQTQLWELGPYALFYLGERKQICPPEFGAGKVCSSGRLFYPGEPVPLSWRLRFPWLRVEQYILIDPSGGKMIQGPGGTDDPPLRGKRFQGQGSVWPASPEKDNPK